MIKDLALILLIRFELASNSTLAAQIQEGGVIMSVCHWVCIGSRVSELLSRVCLLLVSTQDDLGIGSDSCSMSVGFLSVDQCCV